MAVVTALTAARLIEIENNTIVSGTIVDGDLILVRKNGTTFNAGPAQGPSGVSQKYNSGMYYGPEGGRSNIVTTFNRLTSVPFFVSSTQDFNRIGASVVTAGGAGSIFRAGIYRDNGSGQPSTLVVQGAATAATAAGSFEQTIAATLTPGQYWLACVSQGGTGPAPDMRTVVDNIIGASGADALVRAGGVNPYIGWLNTNVTGGLPATFGVTTAVTGTPTLVVLRAA